MAQQNQTLGRGEIHFSRFKPGTKIPEGFRYLGNTPEFNLNVQSETLPHFSMDRGVREKDREVTLETNRSGTFTCDNIDLENLALFFLGEAGTVTQEAANGLSETFEGIKLGHSYQIGETDETPMGAKNVTINAISSGEGAYSPATAATGTITISGGVPSASDTVTIGDRTYTFVASAEEAGEVEIGLDAGATATNLIDEINGEGIGSAHPTVVATSGGSGVVTITAKATGTAGNTIVLTDDADNVTVTGTGTLTGGAEASGAIPLVEGTDFALDSVRGVITFLETSTVLSDGDDVDITDYDIASATYDRTISGNQQVEGAIRFDAYNPEGQQIDYRMGWVKISPNGDLALKGTDWMVTPFNVAILKPEGREAIYANGQPYAA